MQPRSGVPTELVVCSLERWDDVWRRNQFLVRELIAVQPALRVLFVEPAADLLHDLRRRRWPRGTGLRVVEEFPQVRAFRPLRGVPRHGRVADRALCGQVRWAARRLGIEAPALWINDSVYAPLPTATGWPSLYDITDDWLLADAPPEERARQADREELLLATADRVVVCSASLASTRGRSRPVELIGNGVDLEHFRRPRPRPADMPAGPTAVYVGTLHEERVDVDLVAEAARTSGAQIVLVGPNSLTAASTGRLGRMDNVHLLGPRPYDDVPAYLQHADVIIVPHVVSPFTESLDPIKSYECAALGKPTLATPVAGFRTLGPPVVCVGADRFPAMLADWIRHPPATGATPGAEPPTWASRAAEFGSVLAEAAAGRPASPSPRPAGQPAGDVTPGPVKVVVVDHCARLSGAELALLRLLPAMEGVDVHVILAEDGPLTARIADCGASVEVLPMTTAARTLSRHAVGWRTLAQPQALHSAAYVVRLARRLRRLRPDIVHTYSLKAALYGGLAARLAGLPLVWHVHDRIADDYLPGPAVRIIRLAARWLPDALITNSRATEATLGPPSRWRRSQLRTVIHYPVPAVTVAAPPRTGTLRIGMVGRIDPWKGHKVFLRALARAFPETGDPGRRWEAVIVGAPMFGEDAYEKELHELTSELGLDLRVTFLGFREPMLDEFLRMDILVHASVLPEPFGQVVVEGMAAGLPVIASAAGGPAEIIEDSVDGLLCPPGDVEALAGALRTLVDDPDLRDRLGRAAVIRAADFSPPLIAGQVTSFYRRALAVAGRQRRG